MVTFILGMVVGSILLLPGSVFAQAGLQPTSENPEATRSTQTTGGLQNDVTTPLPVSGNQELYLRNQPRSLGVVGSPSQITPSITVGQSTTRNTPQVVEESSDRNLVLLVSAGVLFVLTVAGIFLLRRPTTPVELTTPEKVEYQENHAENASITGKKNKSSKKKKRRHHR